jgi:gliding motility-associated-like protein
MRPITQFLTVVLFLLAAQAIAQPVVLTFEAGAIPSQGAPYPIGTHVTVKARVTNFNNIEGFGFPIVYNKQTIRFDSINEINAPDFYAGANYNSQPAQGKISVSWSAPLNSQTGTLKIATLPNGTSLFTMHFTVLANGTSPITLSATTNPLIEASRQGQSGNVGVNYAAGSLNLALGDGSTPPPSYTGFKIIANSFYVPTGTRACMPVKVNDFDNIQSMIYAAHWNPAVLEFDCIRNISIGNAVQNGNLAFNTNQAAGFQAVGWDDPTFVGASKPDLANIYEMCFRGIGQPGQLSRVWFDGVGLIQGTNEEAVNLAGVNVWTTAVADSGYIRSVIPPSDAIIFVADKDSLPTENGCIDVKVQNFNGFVTDLDFLMTFDNTKLTLTTPIAPGGPLATVANNFTTSTPGQVRFRWTNANGVNLANGTTIISPCFTTTQTTGKYDIKFETPACLGAMVHRKNIVGVPYSFEDGFVELVGAPPPSLTATNPTCNGTANGSIAVTAPSGYTATNYSWNIGSGQINSGLTPGTYTVTVTYAGGSSATSSATLTPPPAIILNTPTSTAVTCFGTNTGTATASATGGTGTLSYKWSNNATTAAITALAAGMYTVTVTDGNVCTKSASITVGGPTADISLPTGNINAVGPSCFGGTNGSIVVNATGGTAPYTYTWNSGSNTNLGAGTYTVTVTDSKGCVKPIQNPITLSTPQALDLQNMTVTNVKCKGSNTGSILLTPSGGTPGANNSYTIVWKNTATNATVNANSLLAGTYNVVVTDNNACTASLTTPATVNEPAVAFTVTTASITPASCGATGAINLAHTGGWAGTPTYAWPAPLPPVPNPTNISSGTYTATVTDPGGCVVTKTETVGGAPALVASVQKQDVACFDDATGGIVLTPSGGAGGPYTANWPSPAPSAGLAISGLVAGSYIPTLTDGQSCSVILPPVVIDGPDGPITISDTTIVKQGTSTLGSIELNVVGGTPNYTYLWSSNETTRDIFNKPAGTYTVTITDANGCKLIQVLTIQSENVVASTTSSSTPACSNDGSIVLNIPSSTVGPFTIAWNGGGPITTADNNYVIQNLSSGPYSVTVTHITTGNTVVLTPMIAQLAIPVYSLFSNPPFADQPTGVASVIPTNTPLGYSWSTGSSASTIFGLTAGMYTVTITNPTSGCTAVEKVTLVAEWPAIVFKVDSTQLAQPMCFGTNTGKVCVKVQGGNPSSYKYLWSNGQTTSCINSQLAGTYTCTVTDGNGTTATTTQVLTYQSDLTINNVNETSLYAGNTQVSSAVACDGAASVVFSGQSGNVGILWSNGITTANNTTLCGGNYAVSVTDALGCVSVWTGELTAPSALSVNSETTIAVKCNGDCNASARVRMSGAIEPYQVTWPTGQFDPQVLSTGFSEETSLCAGSYAVTIRDGNGTITVHQVVVTEPAPLTVDLSVPAGQPSNFGTCDATMSANVSGASTAGPATYEWTSLNRVGKFGNENEAEGLCAGDIIRYLVTDANGCEATAIDTVPFPEDGCLQGRPVMTPNDDNLNDWLEITCITDYRNVVDIYNRWGQLVVSIESYDGSNPTKRWNGTSRFNQDLPEGVYFYVLNLTDNDGVVTQKKGYVNLLR